GWTPLHYGAAFGSTSSIVELLLKSADINAQDLAGRTPLHHACKLNNNKAIATLGVPLERHADTNVQDIDGSTPLHLAVVAGHQEAVEMLVEFGAST
ncbi:ankyrin repeat protein, partial [Cercophora scortea]